MKGVNKHKPWIETSYHGVITENNDTVILDPPLVALDKDAPVPFAAHVSMKTLQQLFGCGSQSQSAACSGKAPSGLGRFVYLPHPQVQPIVAPTGRGSLLQANGGCGKQRGLRDMLAALPAAPTGPGQRVFPEQVVDRL
ncbi:Calsyntenin-2 [Chelonia mydas]|uniref:Calsyntenin-2 n=1 Tax=Chelonia mydas TaxID=8469 RepID=M7B5X3_CHEMY|nr:Calsyntenin-2 [Chelonia mydas]